ncbi:MAG: Na+/H+ antiporter subunit B [Candidatus Scalindua sp.]|nr:Na+/H+ antiporter subunit B [Candidatus Scalindua sp.]
MDSIILRTAARYLMPIFLLFSVIILLRGHNAPGGGFIGGLLAAGAFVFYAIAHGVAEASRKLLIAPYTLIAIGLLVAFGSSIRSFFNDQPFMSSEWSVLNMPWLGKLPIGTPLVFDAGVYLVVIGVTTTIVFSLAEE